MFKIEDRFIQKEEFMRLLFTKIDGVDTHELSMWLKSQTDDEWVVVPKQFVDMSLSFFEERAHKFSKYLAHYEEMLDEFAFIKKYL